MIERRSVGVKLPETGVGAKVGEDEGLAVGWPLLEAVGVGEEVTLGVTVAVGVGVKEAEGVDSKAGPSEASTIKVRVRVLKIPFISRQEMVIL